MAFSPVEGAASSVTGGDFFAGAVGVADGVGLAVGLGLAVAVRVGRGVGVADAEAAAPGDAVAAPDAVGLAFCWVAAAVPAGDGAGSRAGGGAATACDPMDMVKTTANSAVASG
ncbi:hypothetical protein [Arthrobacter sp. UYCu712]|uniref:hypothetical protein n=1 Tax=Arthrobacter sp. UYCu712 TaxID=3156340 RepID=UPI00339900F0